MSLPLSKHQVSPFPYTGLCTMVQFQDISVRSTTLKNKQIFLHEVIWFIFNLRRFKKNGQECMHIITRLCNYLLVFLSLDMHILELLVCCRCGCELGYFVPMFTVDCFCRSLLQIRLFIDAFTLFPWSLFGLAALVLDACWGSSWHIHTHSYK